MKEIILEKLKHVNSLTQNNSKTFKLSNQIVLNCVFHFFNYRLNKKSNEKIIRKNSEV